MRLELIHTAECGGDGCFEVATQLSTSLEILPEERVVRVTAALITNDFLLVVGDFVHLLNEIVYAETGELTVLKSSVEIGNIGVMVARVVDLHGHGIEVWLQGIVAVTQLWLVQY